MITVQNILKYHKQIGNYKNLYIAKSKNKNILQRSSSGGIVTQLLIQGFYKKKFNKALLIDYDEKFQPIVKLVSNKKDILKCSGSKYCEIPLTNLLKTLKSIKSSDTIAIVSLPCQIKIIKNLIKTKHLNKKNIKLIIGLFCGRTMTKQCTNFLLKKLNINRNEIKNMKYRAGKWPGGFYIKTKSGKEYQLKKSFYDILNLAYVPKGCLVCPDYTSEYADISIGDCWLDNYKKYSTVIVRNKIGAELFNSTIEKLHITNITENDLLKSHKHNGTIHQF